MTANNPEQAVIDAIDALIDEQLEQGEARTGYDFGDPQYPKCRCGSKWHGLPYAGCPGTPFEGPIDRNWIRDGTPMRYGRDFALARAYRWHLPEDPFDPSPWIDWDEFRRAMRSTVVLPERPYTEIEIREGDRIGVQRLDGELITGVVTSHVETEPGVWSTTLEEDGSPSSLPDGRPPVPRPSRTPPMWAHDPTRTRRRRNR